MLFENSTFRLLFNFNLKALAFYNLITAFASAFIILNSASALALTLHKFLLRSQNRVAILPLSDAAKCPVPSSVLIGSAQQCTVLPPPPPALVLLSIVVLFHILLPEALR
jgi:hypothetical protein